MERVIGDSEEVKNNIDVVQGWAEYVRDHPRSEWIKQVKPFLDSQIIMANNFYSRLSKTKGGMEKIKLLRESRWAQSEKEKTKI